MKIASNFTDDLIDPITPEQLYEAVTRNIRDPIKSGIVLDENNVNNIDEINNIADIPNKGQVFTGHWADVDASSKGYDFMTGMSDMAKKANQHTHTRREYQFTVKYTQTDIDVEMAGYGNFWDTFEDNVDALRDRRKKNKGSSAAMLPKYKKRLDTMEGMLDNGFSLKFNKSHTFEKPRLTKFKMSNVKGIVHVAISSDSTRQAKFNYIVTDNIDTITLNTYTIISPDSDGVAGLKENEYVVVQGSIVCLFESIL